MQGQLTACFVVVVLIAVTVSEEGAEAAITGVVGVAEGRHVVVIDARGFWVDAGVSSVFSASVSWRADAGACAAVAAVIPWQRGAPRKPK